MTRFTPDLMGDAQASRLREMLVRVSRHWGWLAFFGAVCVIVGVLALAWPGPTLLVLAVIFGIELVISGIVRLVAAVAFPEASGGTRALMAILGLLGLLVGLYALRHVEITVVALGLVLGIYWIIDGVTEIFAAIEHPSLPNRGWVAASGVFGTIAGIILLVWPAISLLTLAVITGIWLLLFGGMQLAAAFQLRSLSHGGRFRAAH